MKNTAVLLITLSLLLVSLLPAGAAAFPLSFEAGTDEAVSDMPENVYVTGGQAYTIPEQSPQRDGYEFLEWNLSFEELQALLTSMTVRNVDYLTELPLSEKVLEDLEVWSEVTVGANEIEGYYLMNDAEQSRVVVEDPALNEVTFLYAPEIQTSYEIRYEANDSEEPLADPEIFEEEIAGTTIQAIAPDFPGYKLEGDQEQSLTLNTDAENNVLTFRYIRQLADVVIRFVDADSIDMHSMDDKEDVDKADYEDLIPHLELKDLPVAEPIEFEFPVIDGYELDGEEEDFELMPEENDNEFIIPYRVSSKSSSNENTDPELIDLALPVDIDEPLEDISFPQEQE